MKDQDVFKQNSFAPLFHAFNQHEDGADEWIDRVELYGLKYIERDRQMPIYNAVDEPHYHSLWEIHLMQKGEQRYEAAGEKLLLREGEFLIVPPGVSHRQVLDERNYCKFSFLVRLPMDTPFFSKQHFSLVIQKNYFQSEASEGMTEILRYLFTHVDLNLRGAPSKLRACVLLFFHMLSDRLREVMGVEESDQAVIPKREKSDDAEFCERVIAYVKDNISTILTLDDLGAVFFLSGRHINRKLKDYYGKTYYVLADRLRADYAKDLLCYSSLSVEEISFNTGFSNASNFIRFFKRVEGQSPNNFRRAFHEGNRGVL